MIPKKLFWLLLFLSTAALAASKPHVITFGKWSSVQWQTGNPDDKPLTLKMRALFVDGKLKEYTTGPPHEVTDRLFAVRRAFRVNDSLPDESPTALRWQWQRGGWLLVDRTTGHVSTLNLPEFDALYSATSWYRDYVAYCGVSDDGKKLYAVVAQISRRKPVLKKPLAGSDGVADEDVPDSACPAPAWQRGPARVTFESGGGKQSYAIRGHVVDLVNDNDEDVEGSK